MGTPEPQFELVALKAGGFSLREQGNGETFHPVVGPMAEARALHVEQQALVVRAKSGPDPLLVWDVGLGAAANAIAVIEAFSEAGPEGGLVDMHSFDLSTAPLEFAAAHASELGYLERHLGALERLISGAAPYPRAQPVELGRVRWWLHLGDFEQLCEVEVLPVPNAILYDPYSAASNPGMWTVDQFTRIYRQLNPERACLLTNYTRSTSVRVALLLAGFFVGAGRGVGEKDQTTVASNLLEFIEKPLDARWLLRVKSSTRGAPMGRGAEAGPISDADFQRLLQHPQFAGGSAEGA
jgi:queuine tRNA-ribosyltransferase